MNAYFYSHRARAQAQAIFTAALIVSLSGCTNIKNDGQRTRTEGALTGAAAGAALGAGAGALLKKNKQGALVGAAAGALVGGLAGAAVGDSVAKKKEGSIQQESALDAQFELLNHKIERLKAENAKRREFASAKEQQLATVLASDRSAGPTVGEFDLRTSLNSEIGKADRAARSWQETIDAHKAVLSKSSGDPRTSELDAEITRLSAQRSELLNQRERLITINKKLAK